MTDRRQQVLFLWTAEASIDASVIAWSWHDGTDGRGPAAPEGSPPYPVASAALRDGWFLIQAPGPGATPTTHETGDFRYQFVFQRVVEPGDQA
ncbi:MAG: hypothetical protein HKN26_08650 [Acidimicrobiales bacterium]|nr:hypothetical protein [Acidimicrobiales bacterium]